MDEEEKVLSKLHIEDARLKRDNGALLPIVEVTTNDKVLVIDLRYNRLQRAGSEVSNAQAMKKSLARITQVLSISNSNTTTNKQDKSLFSGEGKALFDLWLRNKRLGKGINSL